MKYCTACLDPTELMKFNTFEYYYCHTCKKEVKEAVDMTGIDSWKILEDLPTPPDQYATHTSTGYRGKVMWEQNGKLTISVDNAGSYTLFTADKDTFVVTTK